MVTCLVSAEYLAGYLYCVEMMPKAHELQLMLVNTLRKARLLRLDWQLIDI